MDVTTFDNVCMTQSSPERPADVINTTLAAILRNASAVMAAAVLFSSPVICQEPVSSKAAAQTEADGLTSLIDDLAAADFQRRASASRQLKKLTAGDIKTLAALSVEHPSAEVIIRLLAEVDDRYASNDEETVRAASAALEALSETTRLVLAEGANESLRKHWQTRIDLAIKELVNNGAQVKNGSFAKQTTGRWLPQNSVGTVNVFIDENWRGDADALKIFARLSALAGRIRVGGGLVVYLLDGHPLTEPQHTQLAEHVGRERIAERSRVALGIRPHSINLERGVLIQTVTKGSTAAAAKLQPGDLLLGLTARLPDTPKDSVPEASENLRDFDNLVERLKEFRPGDVVYVTVIRDFRMAALQGRLPRAINPSYGEEVVEVTLKGWQELETDGR